MNYAFDHNQEHNGFFDVVRSDDNSEWLNIDDTIANPLGKSYVKFDDIKLPTNEILNYEPEYHDCYKNFDYENMNEVVPSPEVDIDPLSLFAEESSEVYSVLALNHDSICKDAYDLCKNSKTKETCNDSGEAIDPKIMSNIKISQTINDASPKETINQRKKSDKILNKTKKTKSRKKQSSIKFKRFRKFGYSRWGRKEDCQMFSVLRQLWKQESIDIEDFWTDHARISIQHDCVLLNLIPLMNWKGDTQSLLKRIQSQGRDQTLSSRQINMLKKFIKKANRQKKEFSLEDVADSFPGKSTSTLQSALENILTDFKD